ncbi:MAG: hypothetical protein WC683_12595 [bacterium]
MSSIQFVLDNAEVMDWLKKGPKAMSAYLAEISRRLARQALVLFDRTVDTWDHKPGFTASVTLRSGYTVMEAGTDDPIYALVDQGTKPHEIRPRGPGYPLAFRAGYTAKTTPGELRSIRGGSSGPTRFAMRVWHPGTAPRRFTDAIGKELDKAIAKTVNDVSFEAAWGGGLAAPQKETFEVKRPSSAGRRRRR